MATIPQDTDVLFGRGFAISAHPGNQTLRILVRAHKPHFLKQRKNKKRDVAKQIVDDILHKLGGRFLIEDPNNQANATKQNNKEGIYEKAWVCVETEKAVDKVMHRLREKDNQVASDPESQAKADQEFLKEIESMPHKRNSSHTSFPTSEESSPATSVEGNGGTEIHGPPPESTSSAVFMAGESSSEYILPQDPTSFDNFSLSGEPFEADIDLGFDLCELNEEALDPIPLGGGDGLPVDENCISGPSQEVLGTGFASTPVVSFPSAQAPVPPLQQSSLDANGYPFNPLENSSSYALESTENRIQESMSIVDFLKSGRLGNYIVLAQDNCDHLQATQEGIGQNEDSRKCRQRVMENATSLALLLTRLFIEHLSQVDVTTIQMDDFIIDLDIAIDPSKASCSIEEKWVLRLNKVSSVNVNDSRPKANDVVSIQALGKLLYFVFTLGESLPSNLVPDTSSPPQVNGEVREDDAIIERLSKSFCPTEKSVLSTLLQDEVLPLSVCRLIADTIDIGPNGNSDSPFKSVESIEEDLKEMISKPCVFLHDSDSPLGGSHQFGQAHYGRHEEMKTLAAITSRIQQSIYQPNASPSPTFAGIEAVFLRGPAGSGKSCLLQDVREHLLGTEWLVIKAKFERGMEHLSRGIVSSLFDQVVSYLVRMKNSETHSDTEFSRRVSESILDSVGLDRLPSLTEFLPSLPSLFSGLRSATPPKLQGEDTNWRLIYSISKMIEAVLENGRLIMICCDDLQWGDMSALSLISEILVNIGSSKHVSSRCLFFGLYRSDEIGESHPFSTQYAYLKMMPDNITMTEMQLASLTKDDVASMLMVEMRLPRRCVTDLAVNIHNKTTGHAYFVVEVLNTLLRDKIITFSPKSRRFIWDEDTISFVPTGDGVAGLIASNIKSLPLDLLNILQVLSCFGVQSDVQLLRLLEQFQKGITNSLPVFIDKGILEQAGPVVMYSHDLIQQACYESMTLVARQALHLKLGECIGALASEKHNDPLTSNMIQLDLTDKEFFGGRNMTSSLICLACDQIDSADPNFIMDIRHKVRFAGWYLAAGKQTYRQFNAHAALHYYSKGIELIGGDVVCWSIDRQLSHDLHKGAILASFALADTENVALYAQKLMENVSFEECLDIQPIVLQSLSQSGKHEEAINRGIELMRELKFDVPLAPTPPEVMKAMGMADALASSFSKEQMVDMCGMEIDDRVHQVVKTLDAFYTSCYASSSPFLPIVACIIIQFSLKHGICREATVAFATLGMLKIFFAGDYSGGKYWADVVTAMEEKHKSIDRSSIKMETHAQIIVHIAIDIWFQSPRDISEQLVAYHKRVISTGQLHTAMIATGMLCRYKLLGGENLSLLTKRYQKELKIVSKQSHFVAKYLVIDSFLLAELTGQSWDCFSTALGDSFPFKTMSDIQHHAKSEKEGTLLQSTHVFNVIIEYWRGNLMAAEEHSRLASMMFPASKEPSIYNIHHTFFRGLILFQLQRIMGGSNQRLEEGKQMMDELEKWTSNATHVFENKWLLLKAEFYSSLDEPDQALKMYQDSIRIGLNHGNVHEVALAYELFGDFHKNLGHTADSLLCYNKAYEYYKSWGANAVASRLAQKHGIDVTATGAGLLSDHSKRQRE